MGSDKSKITTAEKRHPHDYLLLFTVPMLRTTPQSFLVQSAFAPHLLRLRELLRAHFDRLVVISPTMSEADYKNQKENLYEINENETGIYFLPIVTETNCINGFLKSCVNPYFYRSFLKVFKAIDRSDLIHTGPSLKFYPNPFFAGLIYAILRRKKTVFVWDIDERTTARRLLALRAISARKFIFISLLSILPLIFEIKLAIRFCSLVLLKSKKMINDFAKGKASVKAFRDAAHSNSDIIPEAALQRKISDIKDPQKPIELLYFGRLVPYKGVDLSIRAVMKALEMGANVKLTIIGDGEEKGRLLKLAGELSLMERVTFCEFIQYGPALFEQLYRYHVLLATPLSEDTPRSALDAMASGISVVAFDLSYYKDDLFESGAVTIAPWASVEEIAKRIVYLEKHREEVEEKVKNAVAFSKQNTQEIWLDRRAQWTLDLYKEIKW